MEKIKTLAFVVIAAAFLLSSCSDSLGDRYVGFAQCLSDKSAVMYGAYWCPHCANQKKLFGAEGFSRVSYVECDARGADAKPEICAQKDIKGYPTWIFADGTRLSGEIPLATLGEKTKCALPAASEQKNPA